MESLPDKSLVDQTVATGIAACDALPAADPIRDRLMTALASLSFFYERRSLPQVQIELTTCSTLLDELSGHSAR